MFRTITYLLIALFILGCFANFAQNDYGMMLVAASLLLYSVCLVIEQFISAISRFRRTRSIRGSFHFGQTILALLLWGLASKILWWPFAGFGMVGGCTLLVGMYGGIAVVSLIKLIKSDRLNNGLRFLAASSVAFMLIGIITKLQHWPFPEEYRIVGLTLMSATPAYFFAIKFYFPKEQKSSWTFYGSLPGILPYLYTASVIISIHYWGWRSGIFPGFYSIEKPITWYALKDSESTPENDTRFDIYDNNLRIFWWIREHQVFEIPVNDSITIQLQNQFKIYPTDTTGKININL